MTNWNLLNLEEWELVSIPVPENETPREYLLRMTGHDFDSFEKVSWEDVREFPPIQEWMTQIIARLGKPMPILIKKKEKN
jgi:hypothetical protein